MTDAKAAVRMAGYLIGKLAGRREEPVCQRWGRNSPVVRPLTSPIYVMVRLACLPPARVWIQLAVSLFSPSAERRLCRPIADCPLRIFAHSPAVHPRVLSRV